MCLGWGTSGANRWGEAQGPKDVKIQLGIFLFSARGPLAPFPNVFSKIPTIETSPMRARPRSFFCGPHSFLSLQEDWEVDAGHWSPTLISATSNPADSLLFHYLALCLGSRGPEMDTPSWVSQVWHAGSMCATCTGSMEQGKGHLGRDKNFYSESGKGSGPSPC